MTTLIKRVSWDVLNINEKINYRTNYGFNPRRYTEGFRHTVSENPQFSADVEFIADALEASNTIEVYQRVSSDYWEETVDPEEELDAETYYLMAYLPSSNLWVFYPKYLECLEVLKKRREDEEFFHKLLNDVRR